MRKLIGESFGIIRTGLAPNSTKEINLKLTDTLGKPFRSSGIFSTDQNGILNISENKIQNMISTASSDRQAAFIVRELQEYSMSLKSTERDGHQLFDLRFS